MKQLITQIVTIVLGHIIIEQLLTGLGMYLSDKIPRTQFIRL